MRFLKNAARLRRRRGNLPSLRTEAIEVILASQKLRTPIANCADCLHGDCMAANGWSGKCRLEVRGYYTKFELRKERETK